MNLADAADIAIAREAAEDVERDELPTRAACIRACAFSAEVASDLLEIAERYASECVECTGDGVIDATGNTCPECADVRAVIRKATGR